MFLTDPALRCIAAATNDVLAEHLWRHDTASGDALGELAILLHKVTLRFNDSAAALDKALERLSVRSESARQLLAGGFDLRFAGQLNALTDVYVVQARYTALAEVLLDAYRGWRKHRRIRAGNEKYVLLRPGDPSYGVAMLRRHGPGTWLVFPDSEAASAFRVRHACRIVGHLRRAHTGWVPTACTNPDHDTVANAYVLPTCDDVGAACRSLLRWWHLCHSAAWGGRTPDQLSPAELADLAA